MIIVENETLPDLAPLSENWQLWVYNALDCCVTHEIFHVIYPQLNDGQRATYELSIALQDPIAKIALRGTRVDLPLRKKVVAEFETLLEKLEDQFTRICKEGVGFEINYQSPKQLANFFYGYLKLTPIKTRTPLGHYAVTTNRNALERLANEHFAKPFVNHILAMRDLKKQLDFLRTEIDTDGRIRTNYNIAGTVTGRMASSKSDFGTGTNLQNIEERLREILIPDPGMKICNIDLEQADSRNIGAAAYQAFYDTRGEGFASSYLNACENGDLHTTVCQMAWTALDWGTENPRKIAEKIAYRNLSYRDMAKKLGHGTNYVGGPRTLSKHSKLPLYMCSEFQENYFRAFPCIPALHREIAHLLKTTQTITTIFGRSRVFYGHPSDDKTLRDAVGFTGQSPTSDEINYAIINLKNWTAIEILGQVHDSVYFQYPENLEQEIIPEAIKRMKVELTLKGGRKFHVPVDVSVGWNLAKKRKLSDGTVENPYGLEKWAGVDKRSGAAESLARIRR